MLQAKATNISTVINMEARNNAEEEAGGGGGKQAFEGMSERG